MTVRTWTHDPIPMWEPKRRAWVRNSEKIKEDNEMLQSIPWASTNQKGDVDLLRNAVIFSDLENSGRKVRGLLTAAQAMDEGMALGYTRGWLAPNQAHNRYAAGMIWGGQDFDKYDNTILEFGDEEERFLQQQVNRSKWNLSKVADIPKGHLPVLDLLDETPEDLFSRPAPEGWNTADALKVLEEADPRLYWIYSRELGGPEELKKIVEDARNPYEFFYNLSSSMQVNAMGKSLQVWEERASAAEYGTEYAKSFLINGILNDPDLLATMAVSIGLSAVTGGASLIGGLALLSARAGKGIKAMNKLSNFLGQASKWTRNANKYLPENLGPTLIQSHLMKERYATASKIGKYGINRLADTAEGLVTEPLAEFMNQRRQIAYGTRDEYGIGDIVTEGLVGAAISGPGHLNFLVGKAYSAGGFVGSTLALPFTIPAGKISEKGMLKSVNDFVRKSLRYADPDYLLKASKLFELSDNIKLKLQQGIDPASLITDMEEGTGDPIHDELFKVLLNTIFENGDMSETEFLSSLEEAIDTLSVGYASEWGTFDPTSMAALIAKTMVDQHGLKFRSGEDGSPLTTLDQILAWQQHHFWVYQKAREKGMTFAEYAKHLRETGEHFEILPQYLQDAVAEEMGDSFEGATPEEKYNKAIEVALDLKKKREEELVAPLKNIEEINNDLDKVIEEEGTGDDVTDTSGTTNVLDTHEKMTQKNQDAKDGINKRLIDLKKEERKEAKEKPPTDAKKKHKWDKRRRRRAKRIKRWEQALQRLDDLQRQLDIELQAWIDVNEGDSRVVELHQRMVELKDNVAKSEEALNKAGLHDIHSLNTNVVIFGSEIDNLFKEELTEEEAGDVRKGIHKVREVIGKRRIKTSDLSVAAREALVEMRKQLDDRSSTAKLIDKILNGKQETLTINQVQQGIFNGIRKVIKRKKKKLESSAEWDLHAKAIEEYEKELGEYRIELSKIYKAMYSEEMRVFDTVYQIQQVEKWQKSKMITLDAKKTQADAAVSEWENEGRSTVTLGEFHNLLHTFSPFRQDLAEQLEGKTEEEQAEILNKTYTIKEVKKIVASEYKKAKDRIKKFRPGMSENVKFPVRSSYVRRTYIDQVDDSSIFSVDFDPEYVLENSTPGEPKATPEAPKPVELFTTEELNTKTKKELIEITREQKLATRIVITRSALERKKKAEIIQLLISSQKAPPTAKMDFTRTLQNDVSAWTKFVAHLESLEGSEAGQSKDGVAAFRIFASMPEYFWEIGLGLHIIFKKAIKSQPGQEGIRNLDNVALGSLVHTLRFDLKKVIKIARSWKERGLAQLEGWQKEGLEKVLDSVEEELMKEGDPSSAHNLFLTLEFVKNLQNALQPFNEDLYKNRGYIIEIDPDTGFPTKYIDRSLDQREQDRRWRKAVREAIHQRILWYVENNREEEIINIAERFGIKADSKNWVSTARTLDEVIIKRLHEVNESFIIEDFGNGVLGWDHAGQVGEAIVDTLTGRDMPGRQPLSSIADRTGFTMVNGNEYALEEGTPVQVVEPVEGDLHQGMPVPVWTLAARVNNYKHRARIKYLLDKDKFSEEELAALDEWKKSKTLIEDPDPTGEELPVFLFPQFVGGSLRSKALNRDDLKTLALELMLDIPRIASSFIHDQIRVSRGMPLSFRNDEIVIDDGVDAEDNTITRTVKANTYQGLLGHGDDFIVPFNRIGEIMAIEAASPMFEGLAEASIRAQQRYAKKFKTIWEARNPGKEWTISEAISSVNDSDRNASGFYEMKLLSLANDETSKIEVDGVEYTPPELIMAIRDGVLDHQFSTKEKDDFYLKAGNHIITSLFDDTGGKVPVINQLGQFKQVFALGRAFSTTEEWQEGIQLAKLIENTGDEDAKARLLSKYGLDADKTENLASKLTSVRELFKINVMRRVYGGGRNNYRLEFIKDSQGDGRKALDEIEKAFGLTFTEEEVELFGGALFSYGTAEFNKVLIDEALGLTEEMKKKAVAYLAIERKDQPLLETWKDILNSQHLLDSKTKKEVAKKTRELLSRIDTHRDLLDAKIDEVAAYEGLTREQILTKKKKYAERFQEAKDYLDQLERDGKQLTPGSDEWEVFIKILVPHDQLLASELGYFRALNIMNSSGYQLSLERMNEAAKAFGFLDFDAEDLLGLENRVFYHQMLPTASSYRAYDVVSSGGMNPQGMSLERVVRIGEVEVKGETFLGFKDYMDKRKAAHEASGGEWTESKYREEIRRFLTADDSGDRFGMQELTESPFKGKTREEIDAEIDNLITLQEMINWARYDRPPQSVFKDYTIEDNPAILLENFNRDWFNASERRHETLPQEMALEAEEWEQGGTSNKILRMRAKSGGLVNRNIASRSGGDFPYRPYHIAEQKDVDAGDTGRSLVVVDTSNPKGPRAMLPKYKLSPFHNKGILALQQHYLQEQLDEILHPVDRIREAATVEEHGMVAWDGDKTRGVEVGWIAPWRRSSLPEPREVYYDEFDITGDPASANTARLMADVRNWARERGLEDQLIGDHRAYPYFYIVMEMERTRNEMLSRNPKISNEDEVIAYRNQWLTNLHTISQLSRDIKQGDIKGRTLEEKAREMAIANPPPEGMSWYEMLTSLADENNPNGIMYHPTLLHDALKFGQVAGENMFLSLTADGQEVIGDFDFTDLQLDARVVQAEDFKKYLASIIYTEYIGKAIYDYQVDGEYIYRRMVNVKNEKGEIEEVELWKSPAAWETHIQAEDRVPLINLARENVTEESQSIVFDVTIEEHVYDDAGNVEKYKIVFNQDLPTSEGRPSQIIRNAGAGETGFGMLVGGNTKLKGKTSQLAISPTAALNMFALLENTRLFTRVGTSQALNKSLGVKISADGRKILSVPLQDIMKDALGYTARTIREAALDNSESLQRVAGDQVLETVTDPRSHILGRDVTVVDLDHYVNPRHEGGQHLTTAWIESYISPLLKVTTEIERGGFADIDAGRHEILEWIDRARAGDEMAIAVVMHLSLLLEKPTDSELSSPVRKAFFDMETHRKHYNETFEVADKLFRQIALYNSEEKYHRDMPWYWDARNFMFKAEESNDPVADFKVSLKEADRWNDHDQYILDRFSEENNRGPDADEMEIERNRWADMVYNIAVGTEVNSAEVEAAMSFEPRRFELTEDLDMNISKDARSYDSMQRLAERVGDDNITRVSQNIKSLEQRGFIDATQARIIRAIVLRAYRINPEIFANFSFDIDNRVTGAGGAFKSGSQYYVRFGDKLKRLGTDKLDVIQIVAHELAHIARLKFIADKGSDWMRFESLYNSDAGRSFVQKLVLAWHNGRWTKQAEDEFKNYMSNPEEFIAALGQFYLMKEVQPDISNLNKEELSLLDGAKKILSDIFSFVKRIFDRIGGVWVTYHREDDSLMKEVNILMDRLFGWDSQNRQAMVVQKLNKDQELNWQNRFDEKSKTEYLMDDGTYAKKIKQYLELEQASQERTLTPDEAQMLAELDEQLDEDGGNDYSYSMTGLSRREYFIHKKAAFEKFGRKDKSGLVRLDIEGMLASGTEHAFYGAEELEFSAALHYLITQLESTFGNAIQRGAGAFGANVANFISTLGGLRGDHHGEGVRNAMVNLTAGRTGASHTWNAGHIIPIWLTNLLNDQIATVAGHYTNVNGTPSVQRVLEELAIYSQRIMASYRTIERSFHPILGVLFGEGKIGEKEAERDMNSINTQIALKAEDPKHEIIFEGTAKVAFDRLSGDKQKKVVEAMEDIAATFREYLRRHTDDGIQLGVYGKEFRATIPYKFTNSINDPDEQGSFVDHMSEIIRNNILSEGEEGRIDPVTLYGSGLIPSISSIDGNGRGMANSDSLVRELTQLKEDYPEYYDWLVTFTIKVNDPDNTLTNSQISIKKSHFLKNLNNNDTRANAIREARIGIKRMYQEMARGNITWRSFSGFRSKSEMYRQYRAVAEGHIKPKHRYEALYGLGMHHHIPQYIAFNPRPEVSLIATGISKETAEGVHTHNLVNRASTGQYLPNDNWVIPKIQDAINNPTIRKHLILHPVTLVEDFRRGIADEVGEKMMMAQNYNVHGTYRDIINLFERVVTKSSRNLRNYDGTEMGTSLRKELAQSATVLKEKHDYVRGIQRRASVPNVFENFMMNAAPSITKIAFGGNLMLATTVVEGMMNILNEGFGKGNLKAAMRGIFNPILALKENQREEVVNDLIHLVEALTQGYVPDYEKPATHEVEGWVSRKLKGWGNQMMRPAQYMMKNIAITRAISVREFISKNVKNGKLRDLMNAIHDDPLKNPDDLAARMRKVGISTWAHEMTISYLLRGGFLEREKYLALEEMVAPEEGRYSPFKLYALISKNMKSTDPLYRERMDVVARPKVTEKAYRERMDVVAGLKVIEKAYIEEVIVTPNAFDVYTGGGVMDILFEIFLRYPVLFVSQHVFRKGSRLHPMRYAFGLISMMFLDMLYMNLLKIAGGAKIEDVLEDWEENPEQNFMQYATRLPILGRYMGIIAQAANSIIGGRYGNQAGGFVALGAVTQTGYNIGRATSSWYHDKDEKWQDTINMMRILPMLGDSLVRMGIYAGLGDTVDRREYRGVGGTSVGQPGEEVAGHYGVAYKDMNNTYESWLGDLIGELSPRQPLKWSQLQGQKEVKLPWTGGVSRPSVPTQPSGAQRAPVSVPSPPDAVGAILQQTAPEAPVDAIKRQSI